MSFVDHIGDFMGAGVHYRFRKWLPFWPFLRVRSHTPANKRDIGDALPLEGPHALARLVAAVNPLQAHVMQQTLQQEAIACHVRGDYRAVCIGDSSGFSAEVWVEIADLARAQVILHHPRNRAEKAAQPENSVSSDGQGG
jgi:hypothetical protein